MADPFIDFCKNWYLKVTNNKQKVDVWEILEMNKPKSTGTHLNDQLDLSRSLLLNFLNLP